MTFVYLSYPIMGREGPPDWVTKVLNNSIAKDLGYTFYNPWEPITSQLQNLTSVFTNAAPKSHIDGTALKLEYDLFRPFTEVLQRFTNGDNGIGNDIVFKDLYTLLRADVIVSDLCVPSFGGTSQEVLYGYLFDIPIIGVSDRMINSPWMFGKVKAIANPKTSDDIIQLVSSFEPAKTKMFQQAKELRLAAMKAKQEQESQKK